MQNQLRQNILSIIKQKGMSISRLEKDAGLHKNFISNFLHDKARNPRVDSIAKIAVALGVSIDSLIGAGYDHKDYGLAISRTDIFFEVLNYLSSALEGKKDGQLKFEKVFKAMHEIYTFSLKKDSFDKEFADWFINCQL